MSSKENKAITRRDIDEAWHQGTLTFSMYASPATLPLPHWPLFLIMQNEREKGGIAYDIPTHPRTWSGYDLSQDLSIFLSIGENGESDRRHSFLKAVFYQEKHRL